jgi:chromosome segregation protein
MKLTSLELLGFKSFLNRTIFRFSDGVTCIVGPNGCGKSNIVDAMTWVLGERGTKSLRVKEMGDVIFHGSGSKKQVNMAEVTMGLTNSEKEYVIKRRIYRDGTNEYYINNDLVRLKDIQDFLLGTGIGLHNYAIIEQGNIEYFTQMKPHERRIVVEETSGITRFEEKKRDAFVRMEEVKANLERVEDIQKEVSKNYDRVQEEAARLRVHNRLRGRLREIDVSILIDGFSRLQKKAAKLQEKEEQFLKEIEAKESARQAVRDRLAAKDDEIALIDNVSRKTELDIKEKEKDMESRLLEINYTEGEKKRLQTLAADLRKETDTILHRITEHQSQIVALRASAERERSVLAKAMETGRELETRREELRRVVGGLERETEETRNRLFGVVTRLTETRNNLIDRERRIKEQELRRQRKTEEEKNLRERLRQLEEKLAATKAKVVAEKQEKDR